MINETSQPYPLGDDPPDHGTPSVHDIIRRMDYLHTETSYQLTEIVAALRQVQHSTSKLDERLTTLETELLFKKTIGHTGYRPEPRRMEPSGDRLVEYTIDFDRPRSPFRR